MNNTNMGYTTDFEGNFKLNQPLDKETEKLLFGLSNTRRMKRNITKLSDRLGISVEKATEKYGFDGEFYFDENDIETGGQNETCDIVNYNLPPENQPSLWCQWIYNPEENTIEWDLNEKFYEYEDWIKYLVAFVFEPRGYSLTGKVYWCGERNNDMGKIIIKNNNISIYDSYIKWKKRK